MLQGFKRDDAFKFIVFKWQIATVGKLEFQVVSPVALARVCDGFFRYIHSGYCFSRAGKMSGSVSLTTGCIQHTLASCQFARQDVTVEMLVPDFPYALGCESLTCEFHRFGQTALRIWFCQPMILMQKGRWCSFSLIVAGFRMRTTNPPSFRIGEAASGIQ